MNGAERAWCVRRVGCAGGGRARLLVNFHGAEAKGESSLYPNEVTREA
jgi:hypothetical protein